MPYHGFGYLSLFSDPTDLATCSQRELLLFASFNRVVDTKSSIIQIGPNILNEYKLIIIM